MDNSAENNHDDERPVSLPDNWRSQMRDSLDSPAQLTDRKIPVTTLTADGQSLPVDHGFTMKVPQSFASRMKPGDPDDPLLRQVLPVPEELDQAEGFNRDAVGDLDAMKVPGLLHKYPGRVLLTATAACAIHCRYCFRRHFPYAMATASRDNWREAVSYIRADESIQEVILSGGDPLSLSTSKLQALTDQLADIPHLKTVRIHSRTPVVLPDRITVNFIQWLKSIKLLKIMVLHVNHGNEINTVVSSKLDTIRQTGTVLLNQAVLLKGVNDSVEAQTDLSVRLFESGVLPYYLHLLDKVEGAAHFEVDEIIATRIISKIRDCLPGYLVPRLVREQAGQPSKTVIR